MRTSEFIEKMEELDYMCDIDGAYLDVADAFTGKTVARIGMGRRYIIDTDWISGDLIFEHVFDLLTEYASTPVRDREDSELYLVKHKWLGEGGLNYLNHLTVDDDYNLMTSGNTSSIKTHFTAEDLEQLNIPLDGNSDWEVVEVE